MEIPITQILSDSSVPASHNHMQIINQKLKQPTNDQNYLEQRCLYSKNCHFNYLGLTLQQAIHPSWTCPLGGSLDNPPPTHHQRRLSRLGLQPKPAETQTSNVKILPFRETEEGYGWEETKQSPWLFFRHRTMKDSCFSLLSVTKCDKELVFFGVYEVVLW